MKIRHKKSLPVSLKGTHNLQRNSCQNEKISFALYLHSYKECIHVLEKENKFLL